MHVTTVTCRFDPALGAFDDAPLRLLTRDKVVLSVRDHFFHHGELPHLAFVVVYRLVPPSQPDGSSGRLDPRQPARTSSSDDLRAELAPEVRARFDLLRDWRNRTAQDEGVPAYAVLTNRQIAGRGRQPARPTGSTVAAAGTTRPGTAARPTATGTSPPTATTTWAFAPPARVTRQPPGAHGYPARPRPDPPALPAPTSTSNHPDPGG